MRSVSPRAKLSGDKAMSDEHTDVPTPNSDPEQPTESAPALPLVPAQSPDSSALPLQSLPAALSDVIPENVRMLFRDPALLTNEHSDAYGQLVAILARSLGPQDGYGWILLHDLADADVEIRRLRELKVGVIESARQKRNRCNFQPGNEDIENHPLRNEILAWGRAAKDAPLSEAAEALVQSLRRPPPAQKSPRQIQIESADAFLDCLDNYEAIDKLLANAETRRRELWQDLQLHFESCRLKAARSRDVVDAEYVDTAGPNAPEGA
jgi:hypothetical protein